MQKAIGCRVLEGHLANIQAEHRREKLSVVEDNASLHGKKNKESKCNGARCTYHIDSIDWPSSSPDLNPIEWVGRWMKQRLWNRKPHGG